MNEQWGILAHSGTRYYIFCNLCTKEIGGAPIYFKTWAIYKNSSTIFRFPCYFTDCASVLNPENRLLLFEDSDAHETFPIPDRILEGL